MLNRRTRTVAKRLRGVLVSLLVIAGCATATASELLLLALTRDKAIVLVDGERRVLKVGEGDGRVRLIRADTDSALVEVDGREEVLYAGVVVTPISTEKESGVDNESETDEPVVLWAGSDGFFRVDGEINGATVTFLVDTGASTVAMNEHTARQAGVDLSKGIPGIATTASGVVRMVRVKLRRLDIGGLTAHNVEAGVLMGRFPVEPLLGMSFLSTVNMVREGDKLELVPRW